MAPRDEVPPPTVRPAIAADIPALGRLGVELVTVHHGFDAQRFLAPLPGTAEGYGSYLGSQLGKKGIVILVAERGGRVLGYSYAALEGVDYMALRGPAGALYDVVVNPGSRGQGIGKQLLEATLDALRALGAPRVVLSTAEQNAAAQRLFARAGFRRTMIEMTRELDD